jgi:hypothetical protein
MLIDMNRLSSYVDSLESRLEHSEALVRQLRAELAALHFANSKSSSSQSSASPPDSVDRTVDSSAGNRRLDGSVASLHIMRIALRSLAAPQPPPQADDLMHLEIARKVRFIPLPLKATTAQFFFSSRNFRWARCLNAVSLGKALGLCS